MQGTKKDAAAFNKATKIIQTSETVLLKQTDSLYVKSYQGGRLNV